jgi:penicillin V acylase-like amidase (Ntn superfamily)
MPEGRITMIKRPIFRKVIATVAVFAVVLGTTGQSVFACTGITLKAADGSAVFGRTLEWGSFDLKSRLAVIPHGYKYASHMPDGKEGLSWPGKYGVVGIDAVDGTKQTCRVGPTMSGLESRTDLTAKRAGFCLCPN